MMQFYWLIASADFDIDDQEPQEMLLTKIVKEFLTLRGFARAGAWMEKFKKSNKKSTQCAKS